MKINKEKIMEMMEIEMDSYASKVLDLWIERDGIEVVFEECIKILNGVDSSVR